MIGHGWSWGDKGSRTLNTLKLKLTTTSIELERGLKKLLKMCDGLSLCGTESVNNIVRQLDSQGCPRVRHLRVQDNVDFEYIREKDVLTFLSLTTLTVDGCHRLSFLFSSSVAKSLAELKYLKISDCKIMKMIVECGQENMDNMFSKLEDLKLSKLPELTRFCSDPGMLVTHWPSLERLEVSDCGKVESIAAELSSFREKHKLNPQTQISLFLINKDVLTFMSLTTLRVHGCHHLSFLFSFSMAKSLAELKHLDISDCEIMEMIVECGQENMENMFSKLEDLKLSKLPELTRFCLDPGMLVTHWPLLERLEVSDCGKVESIAAELSSFREKHKLNPQTQKSLFLINKDVFTFMSLTTLRVHGCHRLSFLFSFSMAKSLAKLKHLEISDCEIMEMIVECCQENMNNMFSKLEGLKLSSLPKLTGFCSNPGMLVTHWPLLKKLGVSDCGKVESFAAESHELNPQTQQSLCLIDKDVFTFMSLTTLRVHGCPPPKLLVLIFCG
ncbi:hypothetical protein M0R45_009823 [Rubus argutus]|uniref:Disease resistance protein At4g27190-like leucine-rich repeats domain-containing protein n=1 Tax=Rubus argutus TaxID=59490 RepID=A0AAW1Y8N1_RUBAR